MKNKIVRYVLISLLAVLVVIQFIRPTRNDGEIYSPNHIASLISVSDTIESILQKSCYDCHSNQTHYPWYTQIQPIGFWLNHHVDDGKHELNFSEFASYKKKKQLHKLDECIEMVEQHEMPLASYTLIHQHAKLSAEEQVLLLTWAKNSKQLLSEKVTE
jgi:hypothetical protein